MGVRRLWSAGVAMAAVLVFSAIAYPRLPERVAVSWNAEFEPDGYGPKWQAVLIGNVMPRLRPTWFMGIRTPWTLSSDDVWRRTHRFGAWTAVVAGLALIAAGIAPVEWFRSATWVVAALAGFAPIVYSYVEWVRVGRPERPA